MQPNPTPVNLVLISHLSSEILATKTVPLNKSDQLQPLSTLTDLIHDTFKVAPEDCTLYWRYAEDQFFKIVDFVSYLAALRLMGDNKIYVLLHDQGNNWKDNWHYLDALDRLHDNDERERNRNVYDVMPFKPLEDVLSIIAYLEDLSLSLILTPPKRSDCDVLMFALKKVDAEEGRTWYSSDSVLEVNLVEDVKKATASLLCFANTLGMKGEIISCPHKDIYFLETNTKSETTDLANLFASPAGREMVKYKPRTKLKNKLNPALDSKAGDDNKQAQDESKSSNGSVISSQSERNSRRNSIDLYEEAATILGLTCSQTDDCKCIECQCHYFDFEEEMDFATTPTTTAPTGGEPMNSSCSIQ